MARITKKPEERKMEILSISEELFMKNGYDETLISDIVKKVGVAQGTFYYYFKSKEEIFMEIIKLAWDVIEVELNKKISNINGNSLVKLNELFKTMFSTDHVMTGTKYMRVITDKRNQEKFHNEIDNIRVKKLKPLVSKLVKEAIENETIPVINNPDDIVEIMFFGIAQFIHENSKELSQEKINSIEEILERVLSIEKGFFKFR